jgi:low affinity Fe/Cu permease
MAPTRQEETNQKLSIDLVVVQAQVNRDILALHAKMDHIQDQLSSEIKEVNSALHQFINKF